MTHSIALLHKDADSGYGVSFPGIPGVTTVADMLDEALREASVVLAFALEDWQGELPCPRTLDDLRQDADFRKWPANAAAAAVSPAPQFAHAA